jgi:hypothetical protein
VGGGEGVDGGYGIRTFFAVEVKSAVGNMRNGTSATSGKKMSVNPFFSHIKISPR